MAKVVKVGEKLALALPEQLRSELELKEGDELSVYELRKDVYLIARKGAAIGEKIADATEQKPSGSALAHDEISVLKKLNSFKFEQRVPAVVDKVLSVDERRTLARLLQRNFVKIFKSSKYKEGVYNISDRVYEILRKAAAGVAAPQFAGEKSLPPLESLEKYGYAVVESEGEAKVLSERLEKQIKAGEVRGTRAFDKRYYLARRNFYIATSERIARALKGKEHMGIGEIADAAKISEQAAFTILHLMDEEGEVVEKKRGLFALA